MMLKIGDKLPENLGINQNGEEIKLSDFKDQKLVLYFYPKDNTPGCTAEACSFRDDYAEFRKAGYIVIGVSADSVASHQKFIQKHNLPFDLISDGEMKLAELFGVWGEKNLYGRKYMGMNRTTFIVDENGIITHIFSPKQIKTNEHAKQVLRQINN